MTRFSILRRPLECIISRRHMLRALALGPAALPLAGCWRRSYEWNQKVTLAVHTPGGEISASAISHMEVLIGEMPMTGNDQSNSFEGEATMVEVRPGKFLFALISEDSKWLAWNAWKSSLPLNSKDETYSLISRMRERIVLPTALYPQLVTFKDVNDPKSVIEVKPKDLERHFGPGVSLLSIALEITDEDVTEGAVEKVLPWLHDYFDKMLDGRTFHTLSASNRLANDLAAGSFSTWRKQR